jgi:hypothetical protein
LYSKDENNRIEDWVVNRWKSIREEVEQKYNELKD